MGVLQGLAHTAEGPGHSHAHRASFDSEGRAELVVAQAVAKAQHDESPLGLVQTGQGAGDVVAVAQEIGGQRRVRGGVVAGVRIGRDQPAVPLTAQMIEAAVARNGHEPGPR